MKKYKYYKFTIFAKNMPIKVNIALTHPNVNESENVYVKCIITWDGFFLNCFNENINCPSIEIKREMLNHNML